MQKKKFDIHIQHTYNKTMVTRSKMKPVTVYLQELKYLRFQQMAEQQNRKAAELVRDHGVGAVHDPGMRIGDEYIQNHGENKKSLDSWQPVSLGGLKQDASDWLSKDFQDEMMGASF